MTTRAPLSPLLDHLFPRCDGLLELRAIDAHHTVARTFLRADDAHALTQFVGAHLRDNLYFGTATRRDDSSGTLENCLALPALFVDLDFKHTPEATARQRLYEFPFPPSAAVLSGHGLHVYWRLREPLSLQDPVERALAKSLLRRLAYTLDADLAAAEPARVLRLPGSSNFKYDPPPQVRVDHLADALQYHASEFDDLLPPEPASSTNGAPFVAAEKICDGQRNEELYRSGRSMKARGYGRKAIHAALHAENEEKCEHPLSQDEVERIVANAWTQPDRPDFTQNGHAEPSQEDAPADAPSPPPSFQLVTPPESFVSRYVEYASSRTDAPPEAHEALACGLLSALAGPQVTIPIATAPNGWRLALWVMVIVNSTTGRKTTQQNLAKDILVGALGEACLMEWEGSPQGLIQRLQERDGQATVFLRDEYAGLLAQMNRGGHLAGLPQVFIRAFDGNPLENIRTRKKDKDTGALRSDTDRVAHPYLVKLCATTWDAFVQRATPDNVLDGLLARFAFMTGPAAWQPPKRTTEAMGTARNGLVQEARRIHERAQRVTMLDLDDDVLEAYGRLEQAWLATIAESPCPDVVGPSVKRLAETVLKVAGLLALDASPTDPPRITLAQFAVAELIGARWLTSTRRVVEAIGTTTFERQCEAVEASVRTRPGLHLSALYHRHRRLRKRDFDEIIDALLMQHRIRVDEHKPPGAKGRAPLRLYPDTQEAP